MMLPAESGDFAEASTSQGQGTRRPSTAREVPRLRSHVDAIDTRALVKRFGSVMALDGVNLNVPAGEVFALVGPNGAGKSTLISILCTLMNASEGVARVMDIDVAGEPALVRHEIGVVFQETTLDQQLTARENLRFHCVMYQVPKRERQARIDAVLTTAGLMDRADDVVSTFSGGMARRLEVARALLHTPSVLFLDEPTLGLDPQTRALMWQDLLTWCRRRRVTVFLTTHYMEEAALAERVGIIDRGRMVVVGSPAQLIRDLEADVVELRLVDVDATASGLRTLTAAGWSVSAHAGVEPEIADRLSNEARLRAGSTLFVRVRDGAAAVPMLLSLLGSQVAAVQVVAATLDDVFLHHTGRAPRAASPLALTHAQLDKGGQYR